MTAERATGRSSATLLLPVFFLSGFAALIYQTVWQRVLTLFSGADALAVTLIVAAFMAGLGCGNLAGASWADRLSLRRRFLVFALAELAVGVFAWLSLPLYYDVLYRHLGARTLPQGLIGLLLFLTLLWPTFFMGLSLPLLARTIGPTGKTPEDWVGQLYGFNTLGAALGALVSVWYLARHFGFETSLHVAASLNLVCALVALVLARVVPDDAGAVTAQVTTDPQTAPAMGPMAFGFSTWTLLFALSGFIALSLEILWFRVLGVILKSNAFTFATLLSIYLVGVGGGALWGSRWARRSERPTEVFLLLQALIPAYAALALAGFLHGVAGWSELYAYLGGYETLDLGRTLPALTHVLSWSTLDQDARALVRLFCLLYGFVPLVLFGPPTLLMGLSFPFLQKATQTDPRVLGRRVGVLQAANILGCTLGSIVTGLWLLGQLGTAGTLRLLVGLGALFLLLFAVNTREASRRTRVLGLAGIAPFVLAALILSPTTRSLWAALHGTVPADVVAGEDGSGLAVLRDMRDGTLTTVVFVGGLGQSVLPYGGEHTLLGAFPVLLHSDPSDVAIVGLGSGDTLFGAAARSATTQLDCIEIVRPELESLRILDRTHAYPGLSLLLSDPRMRFLSGDGREFLTRSARRYDVIEADALRPTSAFAGSIYSLEYFSLLRTRLKPGGLAVSWSPTTRVRDTFRRAFPHVLELNQVLIGSESAVVFDPATLRARLDEPFTRAHFARGQVDMVRLMTDFLEAAPTFYGPLAAGAGASDLNTDLYPRDEYLVPRLGPRRR